MTTKVTKESLAQWIAELESQPHLSLREERWLAVMKKCESFMQPLYLPDTYCVHHYDDEEPWDEYALDPDSVKEALEEHGLVVK